MRRWSLVLVCLVVMALAFRSGRRSRAPASEAPAEASWPRAVKGFGLTAPDAKKDAVKHIVEEMAHFMAQQNPPLTLWQPTTEYVKRYVIRGAGNPGEDVELDGVGQAYKTWIYALKPLDRAVLTSLDEGARRVELRQERVIAGTTVFGGLAALLAALAGYSRLARWAGRGSANRG